MRTESWGRGGHSGGPRKAYLAPPGSRARWPPSPPAGRCHRSRSRLLVGRSLAPTEVSDGSKRPRDVTSCCGLHPSWSHTTQVNTGPEQLWVRPAPGRAAVASARGRSRPVGSREPRKPVSPWAQPSSSGPAGPACAASWHSAGFMSRLHRGLSIQSVLTRCRPDDIWVLPAHSPRQTRSSRCVSFPGSSSASSDP